MPIASLNIRATVAAVYVWRKKYRRLILFFLCFRLMLFEFQFFLISSQINIIGYLDIIIINFFALDKINKKNVAIKRVDKSKIDGDEYLKRAYEKELHIMKLCHCPNSVILLEDFQTTNNYNIVFS